MYAALRALPVPEERVARLRHAATLLREHRIAAAAYASLEPSELDQLIADL